MWCPLARRTLASSSSTRRWAEGVLHGLLGATSSSQAAAYMGLDGTGCFCGAESCGGSAGRVPRKCALMQLPPGCNLGFFVQVTDALRNVLRA